MVNVKTTRSSIMDERVVKETSDLKAATGEKPKRVYGEKGKIPTTRMGTAAIPRQQLISVQAYLAKREQGQVDRNLVMENIGKVLRRDIPLRVKAHRADDIVTVLRIKKNLTFIVRSSTVLKDSMLQNLVLSTRMSMFLCHTAQRSNLLIKDGIQSLHFIKRAPISITTDHPVVGIEHLMTSVILAAKYGLLEQEAFKAITLNAAKHLGIDDQVGSIEPGKDADFIIWNGTPFDLRHSPEQFYIEGVKL
ncbi:amidohydrolase family protein [Jeotgalibacillus soli]|uniref:Amidohydrolase n=1 Tax=Jeotgalibacillus soli TaxID=889306 RepID=A0A0C2W7W1_9BACL|nr:amidohydrolase family protein [Jeotgalibacillus soli]KIL52108.1 amidohydrolase [Jeotgalibacillus soli]